MKYTITMTTNVRENQSKIKEIFKSFNLSLFSTKTMNTSNVTLEKHRGKVTYYISVDDDTNVYDLVICLPTSTLPCHDGHFYHVDCYAVDNDVRIQIKTSVGFDSTETLKTGNPTIDAVISSMIHNTINLEDFINKMPGRAVSCDDIHPPSVFHRFAWWN